MKERGWEGGGVEEWIYECVHRYNPTIDMFVNYWARREWNNAKGTHEPTRIKYDYLVSCLYVRKY